MISKMKTVKLINIFWTANPSFAPNLFAKALAQAIKYLRSNRAARDSVLKTLTRLKIESKSSV
ncbi:hypothetical protein IIF7_00710 [Zunongwangia atlantica 22II14-10F7]|uniref:Uncharacterized protein n=2 Tax=Zunongwangia TaxID=417127 RepID=A0A1Y1T849_9FLAO|nr:hypothetical protein IIF7_00710 [Zunongwangia atlantica 22II14-10F7]